MERVQFKPYTTARNKQTEGGGTFITEDNIDNLGGSQVQEMIMGKQGDYSQNHRLSDLKMSTVIIQYSYPASPHINYIIFLTRGLMTSDWILLMTNKWEGGLKKQNKTKQTVTIYIPP